MNRERALPAFCIWKYGYYDLNRRVFIVAADRIVAGRVGAFHRIASVAYESIDPRRCIWGTSRRIQLDLPLGRITRVTLGPLARYGHSWLLNLRVGHALRVEADNGIVFAVVLPPHEARLVSDTLSVLIKGRFFETPEKLVIPAEGRLQWVLTSYCRCVVAPIKLFRSAPLRSLLAIGILLTLIVTFPGARRVATYTLAIGAGAFAMLSLLLLLIAAFIVGPGAYGTFYYFRVLDFALSARRILRPGRLRPRASDPAVPLLPAPLRQPWLGWPMRVLGAVICVPAILILLAADLCNGADDLSLQVRWRILAVAAIALPTAILGVAAVYFGYRMCLRAPSSLPEDGTLTEGGKGAPILYLRAFDDDGFHTFNPGGVFPFLLGLGNPAATGWIGLLNCNPFRVLRMSFGSPLDTAEEQLAAFFSKYGPFVAIGRPGERLAMGGASRLYVPDESWQAVVAALITRAQMVVLQPAETDGVWWEIDRILERIPPERVLLSMANFKDSQARYTLFRLRFEKVTGLLLPRSLEDSVFCRFDSNWHPQMLPSRVRTPVLWPLSRCVLRFGATLEPFLRILQQKPRCEPRSDSLPLRFVGYLGLFILWPAVLLGAASLLITALISAVS